MTAQHAPPVIFLAFANDRQQTGAYLRNLGQEAERLRDALTSAQQAEHCQIEIRTSVTAASILKVLGDPAYQERLAIFHYAGHAEDYALLLENVDGSQHVADGRGLAAFLRQTCGLRLVFLNACSTRLQVQGLLAAGVSAVIATASAIDDILATEFAVQFYTALAGGDSIQRAFEKAQAALQLIHGALTRHLRPNNQLQADHGAASWPWALYVAEGASQAIKEWSLPQAANDPLFGLPPLPELDLPAKPFRDLSWFRRADAPIFFGRGQQIRALYTLVTDAKAAPLVLFYGQSGVGKSSLLDAGLLPRLEQTHCVVYVRREQDKGLLGTLAGALPCPVPPQVGAEVWRAAELYAGKPLTLILDQAEEYFTRPNPALPDEMDQFLAALVAIFADRSQRPQGKLILSFRKEWLAEFERRLGERELPFSKMFLERLDKQGVCEALCGVAETPALQQHYGLTIEDGLADEIANDLLKDRAAPLAPMLQILLTRLWEAATQRNRATPCFDRSLYDQLRRDGLKLKEFLDQQLARLKEQQPEVVDSGLALDLLTFHTTSLGTAEQHDFATLQQEYAHQAAVLPELVRNCQNLYLLVDPAADQADILQKSRLAHDTLAPLVRARFDESDLPGQRARRILESRAVDWDDGNVGTSLDQADLRIIETGKAGMRVWSSDERRLVQASQTERERQQLERMRIEQEREVARERELWMERQSLRKSQIITSITGLVSVMLIAVFSYPYILSLITRGDLVYIKAGTAVIGVNDTRANDNEQPRIEVWLPAFYMERYEVSNQQYQYCIAANRCSEPLGSIRFHDPDFINHPITNLTAIQAAAYCAWIGRRLPTELEWERAARGATGKRWPWGDAPPTSKYAHMPIGAQWPDTTIAVNTESMGISSEGVNHLIGNVWEWTSSFANQTYSNHYVERVWDGKVTSLKALDLLIVRGGGWNSDIQRVTERHSASPDRTSDAFGVRCAKNG